VPPNRRGVFLSDSPLALGSKLLASQLSNKPPELLTPSTPKSLPFPFNPRHACLSLAYYRHSYYNTIDLLIEQIHAKN
jgi:hypothetical protein